MSIEEKKAPKKYELKVPQTFNSGKECKIYVSNLNILQQLLYLLFHLLITQYVLLYDTITHNHIVRHNLPSSQISNSRG